MQLDEFSKCIFHLGPVFLIPRDKAASKRLGGGGARGAGAALTRHRGLPSGLCWWLCWLRRERGRSMFGGRWCCSIYRRAVGCRRQSFGCRLANDSLPVLWVAMEVAEGRCHSCNRFSEGNDSWRTISLAGPGIRAAGAVLVWPVAFVPSEEGCRGRHVEAVAMTPQ